MPGPLDALLLLYALPGVDEVDSSKSPPLTLLEGEVARRLLDPIVTIPARHASKYITMTRA